MNISFKRITSSGSFMPEIDGLRFIAITSVVLYHLRGFIIAKDLHFYADSFDYSWLSRMFSHGALGVPLFFVISGFILGMPFAKHHLAGDNPVSLRKYFTRRLTRLEPPYILIMTILFLAAVFIAKTLPLHKGTLSYLASIFYCHNFIYGRGILPYVNGVAWSLEIEIQFYVLVPLIAHLFAIKSSLIRRLSMTGIALFFLLFKHAVSLPFISILDWLPYFLIGFLLADLNVSKSRIFPKMRLDTLIATCFFVTIWLFENDDFTDQSQKFLWEASQMFCIFIFYYYVLFHKVFRLLSYRAITNIGGMCYTIYLLHYPMISMFGNPLVRHSFSRWGFLNQSIYCILLIAFIMSISSVFFLFIERPCMDKDWVRKLFKRDRNTKGEIGGRNTPTASNKYPGLPGLAMDGPVEEIPELAREAEG